MTRHNHATRPTTLTAMSATLHVLCGANGFSTVTVWKAATANGTPMSLWLSRHQRNGTQRTRPIATRT